jgi:hypothetical protein
MPLKRQAVLKIKAKKLACPIILPLAGVPYFLVSTSPGIASYQLSCRVCHDYVGFRRIHYHAGFIGFHE